MTFNFKAEVMDEPQSEVIIPPEQAVLEWNLFLLKLWQRTQS